MASTNSSEVMPCPNCGVEVGSRDTCPACGAPIAPLLEEPDQTRWDEMSRLIESNNQNLVSAGIRAAESAFGLGCFLGAMMGMVLLVIVFALGSRNWILIGILGMVASIIAVGAAVGISTRAKSATINKAYERSAKHEIERFVLVNHLGRLEFDHWLIKSCRRKRLYENISGYLIRLRQGRQRSRKWDQHRVYPKKTKLLSKH